MKTLIKDCTILTMRSKDDKPFIGNIGIEEDSIVFVGEIPDDFVAESIIDGQDHLAMPGLINAHTHMAMSLLRNYADDLPLMEWLNQHIWPVEAQLSAEDVYMGTLVSIAELIRSGCTTFRDMYFFTDEVAKATQISGLRANLGLGMVGVTDPEYRLFETVESLYKRWHLQAEGRIRIELAPHAPYTCPDAYLIKVSQLAQDLRVPIHIHLSESRFEVESSKRDKGLTPIEHVHQLGLFKSMSSAAHCVHLEENDFKILSEENVSVLYNPSSNLKLGNGFADIRNMLKHNINIALGTDGSSSNNNLNMFEEMHLAALVNKGVEEDPTVLPAYSVLEMATLGGARALGIDTVTGSLEVGKKADILLLDLDKPHLTPMHDPISALVYAASGSDVSHLFCNGKLIMKDYEILTFDEKDVLKKARMLAKELIAKTI